jgi:DNA-directed RNA polymerase specialized sigma24 family protein
MGHARLASFPRLQETTSAARAVEGPADLSTDSEGFWELACPHKKKLYNFISKSLSFSEVADDVFQETLLRGWKYSESYKRGKNFSTWLFAIAHNEVKRHLEAARHHEPLPLWEGLSAADNEA